MADYLITDTELTSVANAIRQKGSTSSLLTWPSGFASAIQNLPSGGGSSVPTWADGTDAEIAEIVSALDSGEMTIAETGWKIGDERLVHINYMAATGVGETQPAGDFVFVLMDSQHYDLANGGKDHFVVGFKSGLENRGYMNSSNSLSSLWEECQRRTWCNSVFRDAIPSTLKSCFKQFICKTAKHKNDSQIIETSDYFALFAFKEIFGAQGYSLSSEANILSQIEYFKTLKSHRIKGYSNYRGSYWWTRSPSYSADTAFCIANTNGESTSMHSGMTDNCVISVFGCI